LIFLLPWPAHGHKWEAEPMEEENSQEKNFPSESKTESLGILKCYPLGKNPESALFDQVSL
jgi:hypothetical protein